MPQTGSDERGGSVATVPPRRARLRPGRVAGVAVLLAVAGLTLLLFPYPLFRHQRQVGLVTLRADEDPGPGIEATLRAAQARILAMPLYRAGERYTMFLCRNEDLYRLFSAVARRPRGTQGLLLSSLTRTVLLSEAGIRQVGERNEGRPRHTRLEGTLDSAIAHEVAHLQARDRLGFVDNARLPAWKSEGWADYSANRGPITEDPDDAFSARVRRLLDESVWLRPRGELDRRHLRWQVLVEYLVDVEGLGFDDLVAQDVTEPGAWSRFEAWLASTGPAAPDPLGAVAQSPDDTARAGP